jgi:hypothetical protein
LEYVLMNILKCYKDFINLIKDNIFNHKCEINIFQKHEELQVILINKSIKMDKIYYYQDKWNELIINEKYKWLLMTLKLKN